MFYIYDAEKIASPYKSGSLDVARSERARKSSAVGKVATSSGSGEQKQVVPDKADEHHRLADQYETVLKKRREKVVVVSQVMTADPVTVDPEDSVEAVRSLFRLRRFRHVPVVKENQLVGLVSDRDILGGEGGLERTVQSVMSTPVLTVRPESPIRGAAKVLIEEHVGALPVVDENHRLVGIITRTDILRAVVFHAPLELWV